MPKIIVMPYNLFRTLQAAILLGLFLYNASAGLAMSKQLHAPIIRTRDAIADTSKNCPKYEQIEKIITEAISIGAPVYNSGYHLACYRIYEWAGYKILYEYGEGCKDMQKILKTAIDKSHGDYSDLEKAWIMRAAFDKIMGVPTQVVDPEKKAGLERRG